MTKSLLNTRRLTAVLLAVLLVFSVTANAAWAEGLTFAAAGHSLQTPAEVYANNVNSTVAINVTVTTNAFGYSPFFDGSESSFISEGSGSGFIIAEDGYILTNFHVVENANDITVKMYSGESYDAELVGYDDSNDIAVLKINASGLKPVTFGDSDAVVVGEDVVAIGNPLGELNFSLTRGVISALDRQMSFSGNVSLKLIQTDCAINSGNSGGALFNMYGEVIGITNAKMSGYSGYGAAVESIAFAIPVNTVLNIVEQIMTTGEISTPYIGVSVKDVDESLMAYGVPKGADIMVVEEDSPAKEAGLQKNDVVVEANGTEIHGSGDLVKVVRSCAAGDKLELRVYRQGQQVDITVKVGENVKSALPTAEPAEK